MLTVGIWSAVARKATYHRRNRTAARPAPPREEAGQVTIGKRLQKAPLYRLVGSGKLTLSHNPLGERTNSKPCSTIPGRASMRPR